MMTVVAVDDTWVGFIPRAIGGAVIKGIVVHVVGVAVAAGCGQRTA